MHIANITGVPCLNGAAIFSMLNLEKCKKLLQQNGQTYSDEQVKQIRHQLYKLANLEYQLFKTLKEKQDGKCDSIRKS